MVRRTKEEALETRERILDAAEVVFYDKGVARASLEDIAAHAKMTRGAIYWHFKDKAELFDAMMQRVVMPAEEMLDRTDACGDTERGSLEALKAATVAVLLRTAKDARVRRIFEIAYHKCEYAGDAIPVRERHIESQSHCLKTIESAMRECIKRGEMPASVDARVAAVGLMSLVSGTIANWVLAPRGFALERHAGTLVDIYFRGLAAAPEAKRRAPRVRQERPHARASARR